MEDNKTISTASVPQVAPVKRTFIIGDEWLYFKFYTGPKTADLILTEMIKPISEQLLSQGMIDYWFFIRYSDPKLHTRVRFHMTDARAVLPIIQMINQVATPFIEQQLIWAVLVDTYQREIERYGVNSMVLSEKLFFHDSRLMVNMLSMIEGDEGELVRWKFALRAVDLFLDDFGLDLEKKQEWVTRGREVFGREFGLTRGLKEQTEKKYRTHRAEIDELMDRKNDEVSEMLPLFQILEQRSAAHQPIVEDILDLDKNNRLMMPLSDLLSSYSHMMINRLFKSKQRLHELVVYDFLHRYYKSEIGRRKYGDKKKKKEKG